MTSRRHKQSLGTNSSVQLNQPLSVGRTDGASLERDAMSTKELVFFLLGDVTPMAVMVALLPLSIGLGVGAGVPGTMWAGSLWTRWRFSSSTRLFASYQPFT